MHELFRNKWQQVPNIDESRCGMSDVACRTAPPIGGLSCFVELVKYSCQCVVKVDVCLRLPFFIINYYSLIIHYSFQLLLRSLRALGRRRRTTSEEMPVFRLRAETSE